MTSDEFLKRYPANDLLRQIDQAQLEKLLPLARELQFRRDQVLFHEGEKSANLYLILSGAIALEVVAGGHAFRIQTLHPGDVLGWSAMAEDGHARFQAKAIESVAALAFPGAPLREACERDPALGYALLKQLLALVTERLDATRIQLVDMYARETHRA